MQLKRCGQQRQQPAEVGGIAKWWSAGNLLGENSRTASLQPNQIRTKGSVAGSSDELFFPTEAKSKSLKGKKSKQKHKGSADEGANSSRLWNAKKTKKDSKSRGSDDTGQAVIRTASMPNFFENEAPSGAQQRADAGTLLSVFLSMNIMSCSRC
ncbi:unnamed protein product [Dibothriocephalus latus]|uniref:Uncharacterized protein n=1 Tax=Dibothriocephalus latus TaxID=60516 RepID=A0A3P7LIH4_DIBLA|nr:unnamed protein product [Dibothriocephalus latus]